MATGWDAFISYSHAQSDGTAIALQRGLERFARPWRQRRAIRVFRDNTALSTNPALWTAIEQGLGSARQLIVLLSPAAAASEYVDQEVAWWLQHKGAGSVLLVQDDGRLAWDDDASAFTADSDVPPCLRTAFAEEPRWLDLRWLRDAPAGTADPRFNEALADLSAPIRAVPRDELIGEDLKQHRRVRLLSRAAITVLSLLLVTAVVATVIAVRQRDEVLRQSVTLRSRQLAGIATGLLPTDLRNAQLMAVQAYQTEASAITRQTLLTAAGASPAVQYVVPFDVAISSLGVGSSVVAVGLQDGRVFTVGLNRGDLPLLRFTAPATVTALRANADGGTLVVQAGAEVWVVAAAGSRKLDVVADDTIEAIALSPSGRRVAVLTGADARAIEVFDAGTGKRLISRADPLGPKPNEALVYPYQTSRLALLDDHRLRLVSSDAHWLTLDLATDGASRVGDTDWVPMSAVYAPSAWVDWLIRAPIGGEHEVRAFSLARAGSAQRAVRSAAVQVADPLAMAISPNGHRLLISDAQGGVSAAATLDAAGNGFAGWFPATPIDGLGAAAAIEFVSNQRAVVASRGDLAVLDFGSPGRDLASAPLGRRRLGVVGEYAQDPRSSALAVSPDGASVAVFDNEQSRLELRAVPGRPGRSLDAVELPIDGAVGSGYGPLWLADNTVLVLDPAGGPAPVDVPDGVRVWRLGLIDDDDEAVERPVAAQARGDGRVLIATSTGRVQTREAPSGRLLAETNPLVEGFGFETGAFSADGRYLALLDSTRSYGDSGTPSLRVLDVTTNEVVHQQPWSRGNDRDDLAFAGSTLLVARADGAVDVMPDAGRGPSARLTTTGTRTSTGSVQRTPPVVGANGLVGFPGRGGLQLFDLTTLQPVVTLAPAPVLQGEPVAYAFSGDGSLLLSGYFGVSDATAVLTFRDLEAGGIVRQLCLDAGGSVSGQDWVRLVGDDPPDELACR